MAKYLDDNGLSHLWAKIKAYVADAISGISDANTTYTLSKSGSTITLTGSDSSTSSVTDDDTTYSDATTSTHGLMSTADKTKLNGIDAGAEINQNAFSKVKVDNITVAADSKTDTLELVAGSNVTLTPDAANDKVTIAATDTTYSDFTGATSSAAGTHGLVPAPIAGDQNALLFGDGDFHPIGFVDASNGSTIIKALTKESSTQTADLIAQFVLNSATSSQAGLMPAADKTKLDSLTITNGVIDASNLPSYVDDVIEAYPRTGQTELSSTWLSTASGGSALTPEAGKIYVLMADSTSYAANTQFRWGGTAYVKLSDGGVSAITNAEIDTICV